MLENLAFDFVGLALLALCLAVAVVPKSRTPNILKYALDDLAMTFRND